MPSGPRQRMIVHMIGNAHIDPIWLWGWQAGVDEAIATVSSAIDRCREYPDFIVTRGEAWIYEQVQALRPDLFEQVARLVREGRWHVTGGQYLQPDTLAPTEEGLRRQFTRGQAYFQNALGVTPRVGYNVDSFGHNGYLPDILSEYGYLGYCFRRPEPHQFKMKSNCFRWRGLGGAEVLGFRMVPGYATAYTELYGQVMLAAEQADATLGHTMCFYGVGNHGGGPTKAQIEWIIENRLAFDGLELRFSTPQAYFDAIAPQADKLPLIADELQYTFPGCYSVMHDIKQEQRRGEHLLQQAAEVLDAFGPPGADAHRAKVERAWDDLLYTQFHDIVTGTAIKSAWPSVRAIQGRARMTGEEVILDATRKYSFCAIPRVNDQQIVVMNSDAQAFDGLVEVETWLDFDVWGNRWISDLQGRPVAFQEVQPEAMQLIPRVIFHGAVPPRGMTQYLVRNDAKPAMPALPGTLSISDTRLSNDRVVVDLGPRGIAGIRLDGRALLGAQGIGLQLRADATDTWTFHKDRWEEAVGARLDDGQWVVEETGPLRVRARLDGRLGHSRVRLTASLGRNDTRVHLALEVNWDERLTLLQLPIHLPGAPATHTDGMAGGQALRASSPVEWPVHGWSKVRVDEVDCALITQDAYSLSLDGELWTWTLLRSPRMAWGGGFPATYHGHDWFSDQGVHEFKFVFDAGAELADAALTHAATRLARPLITFDRYEGMNRPSFGHVPPRGLWGPAMNRNVKDGRVEPPPESESTSAAGLWAVQNEQWKEEAGDN